MATKVKIKDMVTVGALAEELHLPVTQLISELMKNGVMATVNEKIDFDTAEIIVSELDLDVELERDNQSVSRHQERAAKPKSDKAVPRPPVVAVMGHVDHGKTTLLDAIRKSHVASGEAGGITQHISAYQIKHTGRPITFLDTPGHEAFAAIREHGAHLTDIAIIVVAADDGVKPQTIEAIRFARQAGVKMVIAINKIDKDGANVNQLKQQLSEENLLVEDWGGDTTAVEVSAKTGQGIDKLLDLVLLTADVEELGAETDVPAQGLIIESHTEKGLGAVAHGLVELGTLKPGDFVVAGDTYAKLRSLSNTDGKAIEQATSSTPVVMTGFKQLPEFGSEFWVAKNEKHARQASQEFALSAKNSKGKQDMSGSELIRMINRSRDVEQLNIIVKADVQGSVTSVVDSLKTLDTNEVAVQVVASGVGPINENDVYLAGTSQAQILGFNVSLPRNVRQIASRDNVEVKLYSIIYELIDHVKEQMSGLLKPELVENDLGRLLVKGIFKTTAKEVICGGEVTKGSLKLPALARVMRDNQELAEVEITSLKRGPVETKEVEQGEMCGLSFKTDKRLQLQEGDRLELFERRTVQRSLQ